LFNVSVEAVPAPQVGPVAEPEDLAEFATAAAASAQQRAAGGSGGSHEPATALRAKGIQTEAPELTYSGPAEDGSAQVQGNGDAQAAGAGGSRRERREAARRQGRHAKPKSARRR
jgi:preprotein translocase subunit SecA